MVRDTLGEDAVIVATRDEKGGAVRITAAVEPNFEVGRGHESADAATWLQYDTEDEESAVAEEITDAMLRHGVPEDVMDQIISCATVIGLEQPGVALVAALEHLFNFRPLPKKRAAKSLMMVGPPGSGKTLAAAKIAARGVLDGLEVGVVTCDTVRAGGVEQLQAFTKLLKVPLRKATSPKDLRAVLADMAGYDQVIIDTPGLNPFAQEDVKQLAKLIGAGEMEPYLVLPAALDAEESGELGRVFSTIGVNHILPTRIDMARRLGGIIAAAHYGHLVFSDASNTPKVADGLTAINPQTLAQLLMPRAFRQTPVASAQAPKSPLKNTPHTTAKIARTKP